MAHQQRLTGSRLADLVVALPAADRPGVLGRQVRYRFVNLQQAAEEGVVKDELTARLDDLDRAIGAFVRLDAREGRRHLVNALKAEVHKDALAEALRDARVPGAPAHAPPASVPIQPVPDRVPDDDLAGLTCAMLRDVWRRENGNAQPDEGGLANLRQALLVQAIRRARAIRPRDGFEHLLDLVEHAFMSDPAERAKWRKDSLRGRPVALATLRKAKSLPDRPAGLGRAPQYDLFVSHRGAGNDGCGTKDSIALPLAAVLKHGFGRPVFLDRDPEAVRPGESLEASILRGLYTCRTAMVVLSADFWESSWCVRELAVLLRRHLTQGGDPVRLERLTFVAAGGTDEKNFGQGFHDVRVRALRLNALAGTSQRDGGRFRPPDFFVCNTLVASTHVLTRAARAPAKPPSVDAVAAAVRTAERVLQRSLWPGSKHWIFKPDAPRPAPPSVDDLGQQLAGTSLAVPPVRPPSNERQKLESLTKEELKAKLGDYVPGDLRNKSHLVDAVLLRKRTRDSLKAAVKAAGLVAGGTLKDDYVKALIRAGYRVEGAPPAAPPAEHKAPVQRPSFWTGCEELRFTTFDAFFGEAERMGLFEDPLVYDVVEEQADGLVSRFRGVALANYSATSARNRLKSNLTLVKNTANPSRGTLAWYLQESDRARGKARKNLGRLFVRVKKGSSDEGVKRALKKLDRSGA